MKSISMRVKSAFGNGAQYSEAEREEYKAKWEAFALYFQRVRFKGTRGVRVRVTQIVGPLVKESPFGQRRVFELRTEIRQPGMEGLTHVFDVTASLDPRSKLYALYAAVTGENPDTESEFFDFVPGIVTTRDVEAKIIRKKDRNDGKRGGFFFDLDGFEAIFEELDKPADAIREDAWIEPEGTPEVVPTNTTARSVSRGDAVFDDGDEEEAA